MQSSLGVITKMGVWLMPRPECYMPGWLTLRRDADLALLLERLRPLLINGTIPGMPMIINAVCAISALTAREQWSSGSEPLPDEVLETISRQPGMGRWVMRFALYGDEVVVEHQRGVVMRALGSIPGADVTFNKYRGDALPAFTNPHERVQAGVPSIDLNRMTKWYGGEEGGHIGFSSVLPVTGRDAMPLIDMIRRKLGAAGLDYSGVLVPSRRSLVHVCLVVFDTKNEQQTRTAYEVCKGMVEPAARLGYGEYRAHLDFMDLVAEQYDFNDHALRRLNETLKDSLDPNGILSPGKQGIWPRRMRRN
jgi:4-cresol dehydrogenase (hydroxylating)